MISKSMLKQSLLTILVITAAMRVQPVREVVLNESKFLGIF